MAEKRSSPAGRIVNAISRDGMHTRVTAGPTTAGEATDRKDRIVRHPNAAGALRAHVDQMRASSAEAPASGPGPGDRLARLVVPGDPGAPSRSALGLADALLRRHQEKGSETRTSTPAPAPANPDQAPGRHPASTEVSDVRELGRLVRSRRTALDLSQAALAARAGVGRRFLSELEAGKPSLEIGKILAVCQALGLALFAGVADGG